MTVTYSELANRVKECTCIFSNNGELYWNDIKYFNEYIEDVPNKEQIAPCEKEVIVINDILTKAYRAGLDDAKIIYQKQARINAIIRILHNYYDELFTEDEAAEKILELIEYEN